ncbi:SRPBCC family protein [Arthrobacter sp. JSM 101049]|uniref:SRPBCC family protein n=1 Tax=Arthrobacter sp. JSM 101049 TaxID=929097 RepID=UPI003561479A
MESLRTQQDVNATADVVWGVLQDGAQYCTWVPGVEDVEGDVEDGQSIILVGSDGDERTRLRIAAQANRRIMTWQSGAGLGLDSSEVTFDLSDTGFGCTVVLTRRDSGMLHGLLGGDEDAKTRLTELAAALAAAAETRASHRESRHTVDDAAQAADGTDAPASDLNPGSGPAEPRGI